jgi:hypothetical protein
MMKMLKTSALLALLCLPVAANAQYQPRNSTDSYGSRYANLSYTLGEVRLLAEDPDGADDASGIRLGGSALFHPDFFVAGALTSVGSGGNNGYDADTFELGLGYRYALSPRMDLVGIGGLVRVDRDFGNRGDDDDIGPSLTGGARAVLTDAIEVGAFANYTQVFGDGDLGLRGEGLWHFTPNLSALAGLGLSDDVREVNIGARWNFQPTR